MFKHVLWFDTIGERDDARIWILAHIKLATEVALKLSKQYIFYTEHALTEEQIKLLVDTVLPDEHLLNEKL